MGYRSRINNYEFHFNAFAGTFRDAKHLRKNMTETEKILWQAIRNRKISGFKFRRQHPVGQFIVDFYCVEARLVIEVDGEIHNKSEAKERDANRTAELESLGLKVLRFQNQEVDENIERVIEMIIKNLPILPLSKLERGPGGEVKPGERGPGGEVHAVCRLFAKSRNICYLYIFSPDPARLTYAN